MISSGKEAILLSTWFSVWPVPITFQIWVNHSSRSFFVKALIRLNRRQRKLTFICPFRNYTTKGADRKRKNGKSDPSHGRIWSGSKNDGSSQNVRVKPRRPPTQMDEHTIRTGSAITSQHHNASPSCHARSRMAASWDVWIQRTTEGPKKQPTKENSNKKSIIDSS